jgi:uncharacterized protein (DUF934 family)
MKFIDPQNDPWRTAPEADGSRPPPQPHEFSLLTLEQWHAVRGYWPAARQQVGLIMANDHDVEILQPDLPHLTLVVLQFPKWTDGRAYSQARVLRARLGFGGEIRATGEVLVDMLPLLQRTGFDAVQLRADQRLESAQRALRFFAGHYQGDAVERRPPFQRPAQGV